MPAPTDPGEHRPGHPTLFLVDGYALIYRAFFAMLSRPLTTSRGENTSAAWGVANFLQRLRSTHHPDYIAWVHDSGDSFRHEVFADYKATREKLTAELQEDFDRGLDRIGQLLAAHRVPVVTVEGFEADDVIGTMARRGVEAGLEVVIVSGDKDFQQLVRPGVWLLNPGRGGPAAVEEHWVGVHNANERLGVAPERVVDYLALVGDSSDNVPGVPGIGEKTARDLVNEYGDLEAILRAAPGIKGKRPREALLANGERARLSRRLVTILDDVPVAFDLAALEARESGVHERHHRGSVPQPAPQPELGHVDQLLAEPFPPPRAELTPGLKIAMMPVQCGQHVLDPFALVGDREGDGGRPPVAVVPPRRLTSRLPRVGDGLQVHAVVGGRLHRQAAAHAEHQLDVVADALRAGPVGLVHHEQVGDLHQAGLERLNRVAAFRNQDDHRRVGGPGDVELALAHAHRLHEDPVEPEGVEHVGDGSGGRGDAAQRAPRGQGPDEHAGIEGDRFHADPVA
ncbi:MAG: hypothetical protein HUU26_12305 [Gemmatimonadaceae bacterium]|nr:hypothetical protein [Gemmatimonadaceae bacterium]